jgi:hypothetical protein
MSEALEIYLQDHLAGGSHAIDLLYWMKAKHPHDAVGALVGDLVTEIEKDRAVLIEIAGRLGIGESTIKEIGASVGEKINRLKLSDHGATGIGTFEALEFLVLGIHGKSALWSALAALAKTDSRLSGIDFAGLASRAEAQEAAVDRLRLEIAPTALRSAHDS